MGRQPRGDTRGAETILREGLTELGIEAHEAAIGQLIAYVDELAAWNRAYNLTAVRNPGAMVVRHLLDSASIAPWIQGASVLDVGSGAGLPGIPLAVLQVGRGFTLLDSNGKKTRFLRHVKRHLGLDNVLIEGERIETFHGGPFDTVMARAFAEPATFLAAVRDVTAPGGRVLAMQGRRGSAPPASVPGFRLDAGVDLTVPGLDAERHVLIYSRWPESSQ